MSSATRRVPNVFDGDFVLHKLWPTHTFPPTQKRGVKHKREEDSDKQNNKQRADQDEEQEEVEEQDEEEDEEVEEQEAEGQGQEAQKQQTQQEHDQQQEPIQSSHQQKQQAHQECHQQYIKSARIFALTKGLVVAVVKGVQRVTSEGLVPENSTLDPKEFEVQLVQRFLRSLGYEFSLPEALQAVEDTAKLHDLLLTLDGQSRFENNLFTNISNIDQHTHQHVHTVL